MLRTSVVTFCLMAFFMANGCSDKYEHQQMGGDSQQLAKIRQMLGQLRQGPDSLDAALSRQVAAGLSQGRENMVRVRLAEIAGAEKVLLERLDRWGQDMYRATIKYTADGRAHTLAMLLVADGYELDWAGVN